MVRLAVIADSHFDEGSRFEECIRIHDWIAEDIREREVDLVLHAGDVFERKSTPRERAAVASWLQRVAEHAPVVVVRGNHDAVGDLSIFAKLRTRHPVIVEEALGVHVVGGVAVGCLAWPRKAEIFARLGAEVGHEESEQIASSALRTVIQGLGEELRRHHGPRVLLTHAMVTGSKTSLGQPLVGCDLEVGLEDLRAAEADFYALGHIHMPQEWDGPIVYPGSPRRTAFGETEEKGYVLVDLEGETAREARWSRIPTPCTPMLLLTGRVDDVDDPETGEAFRSIVLDEEPENVEGAEIRLRYAVPADERDAVRARAEAWKSNFLGRGAASVKVEEQVIATTRARAPEITGARSIEEKLRTVWDARNDVPAEERASRLVSKAVELEEEVLHAS